MRYGQRAESMFKCQTKNSFIAGRSYLDIMVMKKIAFIICLILYRIPAFAESAYYLPLGGSVYIHGNFPPNDYTKLNGFIRAFNNSFYAAWIEMGVLRIDLTGIKNHRNSSDVGFAGRYHCMPQGLLGTHLFLIFQSMPNATHLKALNPGIEWTFLKYKTAIYTHANIQLAPIKESRDEAEKFQWGGEIVSKTDMPRFSVGSIPLPSTKLTLGLYGNQYAKLMINSNGENQYINKKFSWGFLARLEIRALRFLSVTIHKDQLSPTTVGLKLHYGWQSTDKKPMPYYLYNPFDRYLAYHLDSPPLDNTSQSSDTNNDIEHITLLDKTMPALSRRSSFSLVNITPEPTRPSTATTILELHK